MSPSGLTEDEFTALIKRLKRFTYRATRTQEFNWWTRFLTEKAKEETYKQVLEKWNDVE